METYARQRTTHSNSLEEMANVLLDTMQGILICLDHQHSIVDVSKTVKRVFGFEQNEIIGLSILLFVEESERDAFRKFLLQPCQVSEICSVRMMTGTTNDYRQVKVHRKNKFPFETHDVHSTTMKSNGSNRTILVLTFDDSAYLDINLFDTVKQEFYTKMNLMGEILFEDHRGSLITGYLPNELISHSIFNFVHHDDRLVKLHALWKCVTSSSSKLQWRFTARDGSLVFLNTEYKLVSNHSNRDVIVARNELLTSAQQNQFEELQAAWRHQCAADIKGNSSSFKLIPTSDVDPTSIPAGECRITVPALNMCFSTNKLQSLNINGNIFEGTKTIRPLTIHDYIQILVEHEKNPDYELVQLIQNISSLASRQKTPMESASPSTIERKKVETNDSLVRGILNTPMKSNHEKPTTGESSTLVQLLHSDSSTMRNPNGNSSKTNQSPMDGESIQQQQIDFMKKYRSAKAKLESQLEMTRTHERINGGQMNDVMKRNTILHKLAQLESIKQKHLARTIELNRQQKDFQYSSPKSNSIEQNGTTPTPTPTQYQNSPFYSSNPYELTPPVSMYSDNTPTRVKTPSFDEFLSPTPSYHPVTPSPVSLHSYLNLSYGEPNSMMKQDPGFPF